MRILLFLLAVVPLSAMAIDIYLEREREAREEAFVGLAQRIVAEAIEAPKRQRLIGAVVVPPEDNNGQWGLRGKMFLADTAGEKAHRRISANFEQTCGAIERPGCWQLASLTLDGELVEPLPDSALASLEPQEAAAPEPQEAAELDNGDAPSEEMDQATAEEAVPAPEPPAETAMAADEQSKPAPAAAAEPVVMEPVEAEAVEAEPIEAEPPAPAVVEAAAAPAPSEIAEPAAPDPEPTVAAAPPAPEPEPAPLPEPAPKRVAQTPAVTIDLTKTTVEPPSETADDSAAAAAAPAAESEPAPKPAVQSAKATPALPSAEVQSIALTAAVQAALNELGYNQSIPLKVDGKIGPRTRVAIRDYQRDHGLAQDAKPTRDLLSHMRTRLQERGDAAPSPADTRPSLPEVPSAPAPPLPKIASTSAPLPEAPEAPAVRSDGSAPTAVQAASVTGTTAPARDEDREQSVVYQIQDRLVTLGYDSAEPLTLDGKYGERTRALIARYMSDHDLVGKPEPSRELLRHMEETIRQNRLRGNVGVQR